MAYKAFAAPETRVEDEDFTERRGFSKKGKRTNATCLHLECVDDAYNNVYLSKVYGSFVYYYLLVLYSIFLP